MRMAVTVQPPLGGDTITVNKNGWMTYIKAVITFSEYQIDAYVFFPALALISKRHIQVILTLYRPDRFTCRIEESSAKLLFIFNVPIQFQFRDKGRIRG